ncbi:diguanylate cyclase [Evansella sp. AB-P1]|uniref:sensor domain-containing protein n=1 Tax=Evansella sp. AB-P1 TaxID=3037653 RepID=UPI0024202371|nr:sensor domain-containing diguanylate cyclase [Evansella sp. AB-P1]MDG5786773.1 diguanylate cyclase [Evansella sp. AB-P1]
MKNKIRLLSLAIFLLAVILEVYYFSANEGIPFIRYLFLASLILFVYILGNRLEKLSFTMESLVADNLNLEEQLEKTKQSNQDYKTLFNSLDGAVYSYDLQREKTFFSKGIEDVYGYSSEEFQDNPYLWTDIIFEEDKEKVRIEEEKVLLGESSKVEYRIHHPEYGIRWIMRFFSPIINIDGKVSKVNGQIFDITFRKGLEEELKQMAYYDDLTDLPNRKALYMHITKGLARAKRHKEQLSIMFLDLDDFKYVNDTLGHDAGDELLKEVVRRLQENLREEDLISRIGGDEFILVLEEVASEKMEEIAQRIVETVSKPYQIQGNEAKVSVSIGISTYPEDGEDKDTLIEKADKAMYTAKNQGKNNYKFYTPDLEDYDFQQTGFLDKIKAKLFK